MSGGLMSGQDETPDVNCWTTRMVTFWVMPEREGPMMEENGRRFA